MYDTICYHTRLKRLNDNFVRCLDCGLSMVNQKNILTNKNRREFTNENPNSTRNFERNFNNILEEVDTDYNHRPLEYYSDPKMINLIIVDRTNYLQSNPVKYRVNINGQMIYFLPNKLHELLTKIKAIRINKMQADIIRQNY